MGSSVSKSKVYSDKSKKKIVADDYTPSFEKPCKGVISRVTRMQDPISNTFVWKIEGWSKTVKLRAYSEYFVVGDIEWRIDLDQNFTTPGYLVPSLSRISPCTSDIYAQYTFKFRDQIHGNHKSETAYNYFSSQDWGLSKFLPLAELNDPTKGFIVKDSCIIEATITVLGMNSTFNSNQSTKKIDADNFVSAHQKLCNGVISRVTRMQDPILSTFIWEIQGWSKIVELKAYSEYFVVGDFEWRIDLNQNATTGYLVPHLSKKSQCTEDVYIRYTFNFRDQIHGKHRSVTGYNYFSSLDWGFTKFLPLAELNDPTKGFIVKDSCIIEVTITVLGMSSKVFFDKPTEKIDADSYTPVSHKPCNVSDGVVNRFTRMQEPKSSTFSWKIEGWSKTREMKAHSEYFAVGDIEWSIYFEQNTRHLGLFLEHNTPCSGDVYARYTFIFRDQIHGKHKSRTDYHHFKRNRNWGERKVLLLDELNDPTKGFIVKDTCIIEATVTMLGFSHC
ncbi:hypothetical protein GIB67_038002 [Kingdonia uniflora]|uniref:MATH domain-containing protein n=1 Tax=Kingdonia uniflora TaxID=39325 RepID=A0A7J7LHP6_9MAGN|nr:hypothetical protein GIB67_038002 [Kingdonia uniflora]